MRYLSYSVVLLLVFAVFLVGCDEEQQKALEKVTGNIVNVPAPSASPAGSSSEGSDETDSGSGQDDAPAPPKETFFNVNKTDTPRCGDGVCDGKETCGSCVKDCGCKAPAICHDSVCKTPECSSDADCVDDDPCTVDRCFYAGHPNAYCSEEMITEFRNNDGCCPKGGWVDKDTDCKPVCGNHKCEFGETVAMCEEDCKNAGPVSSSSPPPSNPYPN